MSTLPSSHINEYGTGHTEAIVTTNLDAANALYRTNRCGAVMVNINGVHRRPFGFGMRSASPPSFMPADRWDYGIDVDQVDRMGPATSGLTPLAEETRSC